MKKLDNFFKITERNSSIRTEVISGTTTFLTMSYIIFVQPAILSVAGLDFGAVMVATCLASAIGCILMALLANYPVALAPAMGHNFFFAFTVCGAVATGGMGFTWQQGLAAVFVSGMIFLLLALVGFREKIIAAVPVSLRHAIAVGIGLLIALLGLEWAGIIVDKPGVLIGLGSLSSGPALIASLGTIVIAILMIKKVRGAILVGILFTSLLAVATGHSTFHGIADLPPSLAPTLFKLDFLGLFEHPQFWVAIAIFFFLDLFDTIGTLLGLGEAAGLVDEDGNLPNAENALAADAGATVAGAMMGTSTVTSYIESSTGIAVGGKTGMSSIVTAFLFLLAIFFSPLAQTIGGGYIAPSGETLYPIIAPALIIVGSLMLPLCSKIGWDNFSESFPAYLTIIFIPLTVSITEGIAIGFISYSILKSAEGKFFDVNMVTHAVALAFLFRYIFLV